MENTTDRFYIQRVKAGDIQAFAPIVHKYQRMVFTIIVKIVDNKEEAEDIMQEVFVKVFNSLTQFKEEAEFSTWLYRIAYNTTLSELRKRKINFTSINDSLLTVDEYIDENLNESNKEEKLQYLEVALKKLSPEEIFLVTLFYMDNRTIEEVSEISRLSTSNVKVKLHRIRKKLAIEINQMMQV